MTGAGPLTLKRTIEAQLEALAAASRRRTLSPRRYGPYDQDHGDRIDLTHNDYLGLRQDPEFHERVLQSIRTLPVGSGGSRLLGGEHEVFSELEETFAAFKRAPSALFFPSGYAANEAVGSALGKIAGVRLFSDSLNHASIIDGLRLSGLPREERVIVAHNNLSDLEEKLSSSPAAINLIYTESLFSMDGDVASLRQLCRLASQYRGVLIIDEAHAVGCFGPHGEGLVAEDQLCHDHLITINTCGKALGAAGAVVCAPTWVRDYLVNIARSFIYTTAASPWVAAAIKVSLKLLPQELKTRRLRLQEVAKTMRRALQDLEFDCGASTSHIIPIITGSDKSALDLSNILAKQGIDARAIRPPTVAEGQARLRISLHAALSDAQLERIVNALAACRANL